MGDIVFRFMTDSDADAQTVTYWRNQPDAREGFFCDDVVTPDTHKEFIRNRPMHNLIWMVEDDGVPVAMCGLKVNIKQRDAEYGQVYTDPHHKRQGYARTAIRHGQWYSFEVLRLDKIWLEAYEDNVAVLTMDRSEGMRDVGQSRTIRNRAVLRLEMTADEYWERKNDSRS
jgi:RimJ/RimL family protein N-acetyltransferase